MIQWRFTFSGVGATLHKIWTMFQRIHTKPHFFSLSPLQVGSFNYDMSKMVFTNEFVPNEQDAIKSILDYEIQIKDLRPDQTHYMALGELPTNQYCTVYIPH